MLALVVSQNLGELEPSRRVVVVDRHAASSGLSGLCLRRRRHLVHNHSAWRARVKVNDTFEDFLTYCRRTVVHARCPTTGSPCGAGSRAGERGEAAQGATAAEPRRAGTTRRTSPRRCASCSTSDRRTSRAFSSRCPHCCAGVSEQQWHWTGTGPVVRGTVLVDHVRRAHLSVSSRKCRRANARPEPDSR